MTRCATASGKDVGAIAVSDVIDGAHTWADFEAYGRGQGTWFTLLLLICHGVHSHEKLAQVFGRPDGGACWSCFRPWLSCSHGPQRLRVASQLGVQDVRRS